MKMCHFLYSLVVVTLMVTYMTELTTAATKFRIRSGQCYSKLATCLKNSATGTGTKWDVCSTRYVTKWYKFQTE